MKGATERAREALSSADFRRLFAARIASQLGDGLFQAVIVASVVFSPEKQSTTVGFARATAVLVVPYSVLGPFAGVFIDRWRRRRILVLTPLVRAVAALLLLPGTGAAAPFYAGALIVLSANRFFLVTAGTVTPKLVVFEDLLVANSLNSARHRRVGVGRRRVAVAVDGDADALRRGRHARVLLLQAPAREHGGRVGALRDLAHGGAVGARIRHRVDHPDEPVRSATPGSGPAAGAGPGGR